MSPTRSSRTIDLALLETMSDDDVARTLRMTHADPADLARTIARNPHSTIEPVRHGSADTQGRRALEGLGAERGGRSIAAGLDIEQTIGEGGMGVVRLATQRSLGRKVAVKTLQPASKSEGATLRLLREAWVTGALEHPNIVPVYDLGLDEDGSPIIVLKRIEGIEWGLVMRDATAVRERFGADDLLEHNLRVLGQVCNAVSFAHARGVLHRDLKPENVMIGRFGEVCVVDWGIAVSLTEDPHGRLPFAADQRDMAGTPCYMAPEMLGAGDSLGERTDVYLLGAILHEILTGEPPHTGTFKQIVGSILLSAFVYDPSVPRELADIAQRAMSRDPAQRFGSAEELKLRIEWYLRHRESLAISAEASRRLAEMQALVATDAGVESLHDLLYRLFAECRFGFRQALEQSPDNETARLELRRAIEVVVRFELERGAAEAAAGALAELEDAPPELAARVNEALRARAADKDKMERLERMQAELDPTTGRRARVAVLSLLAVVWTITPQLMGAVERRWPDYPYWVSYAWSVGVIVVAWAFVSWRRELLTKTAFNRRMIATGLLAFAAQLTLELGGHLLGLPTAATVTLHMLVWGAALALTTSVEPRFWYPVGGFFLGFILAARWPERRWDVMSGTLLVLLATFARAWWKPFEDRPEFVDRIHAGRRAKRAASQRAREPASSRGPSGP